MEGVVAHPMRQGGWPPGLTVRHGVRAVAVHADVTGSRSLTAAREAMRAEGVDGLLNQNLTAWQSWTHVVDEHDADASYATVRDYIQTRNHISSSKIH